jgi:hypothetical protein
MMRFFDRSLLVAVAAVAALGLPVGALAQESQKPADAGQIEQLQKQLAAMQQQLDQLQKTIASSAVPTDQRATMSKHMAMMQQGWQGMHEQSCTMHPTEGCAQMGGGAGMGMGGGMGMGMGRKTPGQ